MKRLLVALAIAACLLAFSPALNAQDCSNWSVWDLRGTYTMSGSGSIDLSKTFPGKGLPTGIFPMTWVGAKSLDGSGGGSGWVTFNAAGVMMTAQLTNLAYSISPDCSIVATFSMTVSGTTVGPITRIMVPVPKSTGLELHMIMGGYPPGTSTTGSAIDLAVAHRMSMM